jgi:hypothetical protein
MRTMMNILIIFGSINAGAQENIVASLPEAEFEIDGMTKLASVLLVTGMSYGISYLNKAYENAGVRVGICLPDGKEYIEPREIIKILNEAGKPTYNVNDASSLVISELAKSNPCR